MARGKAESHGTKETPQVGRVKACNNGKQTGRRLRWSGNLPKPPKGDVPWALCRDELAGLQRAEHARLVQRTRAWQELMVPECQSIDTERSARGLKFLYSSEELELVLVFGRACGHTLYRETRAHLAGDDPRPREILGLTEARNRQQRPLTAHRIRLRDGVPSATTMWRHQKRFTEERRERIWMAIERELRLEHLATPELQQEALVINLDGSPLLTHYTAPMKSRSYGGVLNDENGPFASTRKITCPDGGYVPDSAPAGKRGHGWNLVMISTSTGVPLAWALPPLNESERTTARQLLSEDFARDVAPFLEGKIKVLSADGAFHQPELRAQLRQFGIVENIHLVSHGPARRSKNRAAQFNRARFTIVGYPKWYANGHREIFCACGRGVTKVIECGKDGDALVRVQGQCPDCGTISIKSGDWRFTEDNRFVRCHPNDPVQERDWAFGNPLTFNDLNAEVYGKARFGHNEGLHGTLSNRFRLIQYKRWFRRAAQARIETAMTFSIMHALALEQRRLAAAPPGLALAA